MPADLACSGRDCSGNMPATVRNASTQTVLQAVNHSIETQCGSIASFSAGRLFGRRCETGCGRPAIPGFGVREVLRMLVFTKRVS